MTIATTAGSVEARIVRFWRRDSVLEIKVHVPFSRQREAAKTLLTSGQVTDARPGRGGVSPSTRR